MRDAAGMRGVIDMSHGGNFFPFVSQEIVRSQHVAAGDKAKTVASKPRIIIQGAGPTVGTVPGAGLPCWA
ncbi:MAG: hypothetical protein OEQ18_01395 [Gammaproteobacteria bacterium]|nr:hypothetical protein [Gammaproteobacteria bacterium]